MKKYEQIEIIISYSIEDIVRTSGPDGDNTLPWVDMGLDDDFNTQN